MTLPQHLEELRRRLLKCLAAVAVTSILAFHWSAEAIRWLSAPAGRLVFFSPAEALLSRIKIAFWLGFFAAMPVMLYQLWSFLVSALTHREKKVLAKILPLSWALFAAGCAGALWGVIPGAVRILVSYGTPELTPLLSVESYLRFAVSLTLAFGLLFQLPLILYVLVGLGVVALERLVAWRRGAWAGAFVLAALMTPGPDVFSQILLAVPMGALFELSLLAMRFNGMGRAASASMVE